MSKSKHDWLHDKWRPMMGWVYMATCITDFILFPILWSLIQAYGKGQVNMQWQPLTLQGAGLFHIAMGAVLGIAAYGRTQEKLNGVSVTQLPSNVGTTYVPPQPISQPNFGQPNSTVVTQTYGNVPNNSYQSGYNNAPTFISKTGKVGPIIIEPEL